MPMYIYMMRLVFELKLLLSAAWLALPIVVLAYRSKCWLAELHVVLERQRVGACLRSYIARCRGFLRPGKAVQFRHETERAAHRRASSEKEPHTRRKEKHHVEPMRRNKASSVSVASCGNIGRNRSPCCTPPPNAGTTNVCTHGNVSASGSEKLPRIRYGTCGTLSLDYLCVPLSPSLIHQQRVNVSCIQQHRVRKHKILQMTETSRNACARGDYHSCHYCTRTLTVPSVGQHVSISIAALSPPVVWRRGDIQAVKA